MATTGQIPPDACDCHVHVVGPANRHPMDPARLYSPPEASVADLCALRVRTGVGRHVLVQPSFYGADNRCMLEALKALGDSARGVAVVQPDISDAALRTLHDQGVRGLRLNVEMDGGRGPTDPSRIADFAGRIAPLGWHIQVYAGLEVVAALAPAIEASPVPVVIDHFGLAMAGGGTGQPGFAALLDMVRSGKTYVKLSAPHRISRHDSDHADCAPVAAALIEAAPGRMLWGSDWPHAVRTPHAKPTDIHPFAPIDDVRNLALLRRWVADEAMFRRILVDNPADLYRFT